MSLMIHLPRHRLLCGSPAKFYRLKKSCPELFDIDRDVTQPIERLSPKKSKVKVQGQSERVADDEIKALLKDISSTSENLLKQKMLRKAHRNLIGICRICCV